jgi:hypothetical protein
VADSSKRSGLNKRKVTTTRTITAELKITETVEKTEDPPLFSMKDFPKKRMWFIGLGVLLDVASNLLASFLQSTFFLQNLIPISLLNLCVALLFVYVFYKGARKES